MDDAIERLSEMTQDDFDWAMHVLSPETLLNEACYWQESAHGWFELVQDARENDMGASVIIRRQTYHAEAHKIARLYAGTWE